MKYIKKYWQFIFPILIMILIWNFSAQNSTDSDGLSIPLAALLGLSNSALRKIAHFVIYLILGVSLTNAFRSLKPKKFPYLRPLILSAIIALVYASLDEYHQSFIPGRDGNPGDILIDTLGAIAGICIFVAIFCRIKQKKSK